MENEKQLEKLLTEMNQETVGFRGDELGLFDYQDLDQLDMLINTIKKNY